MHRIEQRLTEVRSRVDKAAQEAGRHSDTVQVLCVSKRQSVEKIRAVSSLGMRHFGENYLQEALEKQKALQDLDIFWHFIGPIQSNKTRAIANHFSWVHSVDRLKIAERLSEQSDVDEAINICIQVNIDDEPSKSGVKPDEVKTLIASVAKLPKLRLRGLMLIPRARDNITEQRAVFERAHRLLNDINRELSLQMDTLSMGMSEDLEAAIAEGATIVRIGTAIFGERSQK